MDEKIHEFIQKVKSESDRKLIDDCLRIVALSKKASKTDWKWDGMTIEDDYVHVRQGSVLGDTAIVLDETYENSGNDCLFVSEAARLVVHLANHILESRGIIYDPAKGDTP